MAVITKITTQKRDTGRYNIYMDFGKGEEFAFSADESVIVKFHLRKGMELDEFALAEVGYHDEIRKAYNNAINYLAFKMRTEKEVRGHLKEKKLEDAAIDEVIHRLSDQGYLNDKEYADAYVRTQISTTDKGAYVVKMELRERGVADSLIEEALKQYTPEEQFEKAKDLAEKYARKYASESERVLKQKLDAMLRRKGYQTDAIQFALNEADFGREEDDELEAIKVQGEKAHRKHAKLSGYAYERKMKETLFRKGFPIELIDRYLASMEEE
ncbi:recombination regulator RecX [Neobacillus notoginsengisoli]|uniref:Regulatory protein RecX n=1 Tax=Neobacillus notoginsengisoli TaxID=1578198 RepID=A0A417YJV6_9BACI|nr:recombination regulator RecX [Neobacillus notoginsengisoli]RHW33350.1 recombination regulator RecX [Neobacillus notoginsengisoli]